MPSQDREAGKVVTQKAVASLAARRSGMVGYLMSKDRRVDVRSSARLVYLSTTRRFITPSLNKPEILRITVGETRQALIESKKFNSVIGGILLSIAMKMVEKLVEKWLDENLFNIESVPPQFVKGEPGYAEK